ncbi:histidinol-phosphate transaminase [Aquimarina sp. AU474]|uniref:histidinol-phosphate transaminase n=1 Tax=Aquimarina sp. AU474 TaxID=2108529 RepID=UPI000D69B33B|nr:histidinol-phosphate transaminase [Aquimarina sp. AU474]
MKNTQFNIKWLVRENIQDLQPYSSARDEYVSDGSKMIFLDANENPFDNGVNRYPDPQQRNLKSILAQQKGVTQQNILLGNGSDEVLDLIFRAFCEPKEDNIITLPPTYGMYQVLATINNIENQKVLLTKGFQPNVSAIFEAVNQNTKIIFLCSPNNPTGNSFSEESIVKILENFKGLVVIDEAYIDFSTKDSWLSSIEKYSNLIITQTLSKAYGLAGIRLGICYSSQPIIEILNKIKPPYNVNELTQQRAFSRISDPSKVTIEVSKILKERNELVAILQEVSFVTKIYETDANFILVQVDNADKRYKQLLDMGIVVRNRSTQPLCEDTLRFTVGTSEENNVLIQRIREIIN